MPNVIQQVRVGELEGERTQSLLPRRYPRQRIMKGAMPNVIQQVRVGELEGERTQSLPPRR